MYIKWVEIDGFKSYAQKVKVGAFDSEFNAITGLNGSGKSNILDSICFLLGITNLSQIRATQQQELVYKSGQAGITKATVTIAFDNKDKDCKPVGYEHYEEIIVTRQIIIGGRNKYLINGRNAEAKRVADLFRSVQLNVNNPHFLIMQGRITKVLNMKPKEILSMIEEAAGTKMYETKKEQSQKTMQKKEAKVREIDSMLADDILPKVEQLKKDRQAYLEYQRINRDWEALQRLLAAWNYVLSRKHYANSLEESKKILADAENKREQMILEEEEAEAIKGRIKEKEKDIEKEDRDGSEQKLTKDRDTALVTRGETQSKLKESQDNLKTAEKNKKATEKSIGDDKKDLIKKRNELSEMDKKYGGTEEQGKKAQEALDKAQKRKDALAKGLTTDEQGNEASLQQQLQKARTELTAAKTEVKKSENLINHTRPELEKKQRELKNTKSGSDQDEKLRQNLEKDLANLQNQQARLDFNEADEQTLNAERTKLQNEIRTAENNIQDFEQRYPNMRFEYRDPVRNFDHSKVKGLVARLFQLEKPGTATALEVAAGGGLFNVIVDNEDTGKLLLNHGQLQRRVTIIPLNKIAARKVDDKTVNIAKRMVGDENCELALNLIGYQDELERAMVHIFGGTLVCKDMNVAKKVTFHKDVYTRSVTLTGEKFDPQGTLTGGSRPNRSAMLETFEPINKMMTDKEEKERRCTQIRAQLESMRQKGEAFRKVNRDIDAKERQLKSLVDKLAATDFHRIGAEVQELQAKIAEAEQSKKERSQAIPKLDAKVKDLEDKIAHADEYRKKEIKEAETQLKTAQKELNAIKKDFETSREKLDAIRLEITGLEESIAKDETKLEEEKGKVEIAKNGVEKCNNSLKTAEHGVKMAEANLKEYREEMKRKDSEIRSMQKELSKVQESIKAAELAIQKCEMNAKTEEENANQMKHIASKIREKNNWIVAEEQHFGKKGTSYDFSKYTSVEEAKTKMEEFQSQKDQLHKTVNFKAMNLLKESEEKALTLQKKKERLEEDKRSIEQTIKDLDEQKNEAIKNAWQQVTSDFGSIFTQLLPGTQAKLVPLQGKHVLDGLEIKVAFGDVWKESLGELSGGQRSLVALSLVLAMLKFKPAPIYILDEVDAALDLSHTQNIGTMIKTHFRASQFIVVSLKDGMFNNANVLFKTRFVDGCSTVTRHTPQQAATGALRTSNKENKK